MRLIGFLILSLNGLERSLDPSGLIDVLINIPAILRALKLAVLIVAFW